MMAFVKYMHVERLTEDNIEVRGILDGKVYIYPKLDGSNHCVWYDEEKAQVRCASRNQVITSDYDPTKFVRTYYLPNKEQIDAFIMKHKDWVLYGEFMKPHVIKTYMNSVWDDWFVFDVYDKTQGRWLTLEEYSTDLQNWGISMIPCMAIRFNPTIDELNELVDKNNAFMEHSADIGEGIVIKNYGYSNAYGRTIWAKIVRDEFKVKAKSTPTERGEDVSLEYTLANQYLTPDFIEKEYYKFIDVSGEWNDKMIPSFIQQVMFEWWKDYSYDVIATLKKPIDMGSFRRHMSRNIVAKVKRMRK